MAETPYPVIDFSSYMVERTEHFTGRTWVFQAINDWLSKQLASRYFLLTGDPGSGKSAIAARLCQFSLSEISPLDGFPALAPKSLSAFHFCSARSGRWIDPSVFAESLAMQLASRYPEFAEALTEKSGDRQIRIEVDQNAVDVSGTMVGVVIKSLDVSKVSAEDAFNRVVREPLLALCTAKPKERIVILVDALDEARAYTGRINIIELLARTGDLPQGVRLILTSRKDAQVENEFPTAEGLYLSAVEYDQRNQGDVFNYVKNRLSEDVHLSAKGSQWEPTRLTELIKTIVTKSAGNFQYVAFLMDSMAKGKRALDELEGLPSGLDALYYDSLNRVVKLGGDNWAKDYLPLMGVLSVARESLTFEQLRLLCRQTETELWDHLNDLEQFIHEMRIYDVQGQEVPKYALYHQSLIDFLGCRSVIVEGKKLRNLFYLPTDDQHRRIVDFYRGESKTWENTNWGKMDDYCLTHLADHLFVLREYPEYRSQLYKLISQEWMHARVERENYRYDGFIGDLTLAWQHAHDEAMADIEAGKEPSTLAECVRYALIRSSITSLSSQYEPMLVKRAVETGIWSFARALSVASQVRHPRARARLICAALEADFPGANESERCKASSDALLVVREIEDHESRAVALCALAPYLKVQEKEMVLGEALSAAQMVSDLAQRVKTLAAIAPQLSEPEKNTALRAALSALAPWGQGIGEFSGSEASQHPKVQSSAKQTNLLPGAFGLAEIESLRALDALAPQLSGPLLADALSLARRIDANVPRVRALATLAQQLSGAEKEDTLREAILAIREIEDGRSCANELVVLAPHLSGSLIIEALSSAREIIKDQASLAMALTALAQQMNGPVKEEVQREALLKARVIEDEEYRAYILATLGLQLRGSLLEEAISTARKIKSRASYAKVLVALVPQLTGPEKEERLREALSVIDEVDDGRSRARLLAALVPHLSVEVAFLKAQAINEAPLRMEVLVRIAPHLSNGKWEAALREAVDAARSRKSWGPGTANALLSELVPQLNRALLSEMLNGQGMNDGEFCSRALAAIARKLHGPQKEIALHEALIVTNEVENGWKTASALDALASQLTGPLVAEALKIARGINNESLKANALTALAGQLRGREKETVIGEALSLANNIDKKAQRAEVLAALAPHLSGDEKESALRSALSAVRGIEGLIPAQDDQTRAKVLARLVPELSGSLLTEALSVVRGMGVGRARAEALAALAPQLTEAKKEAVLRAELSEAPKKESDWRRAEVLVALASHLKGPLLAEALSLARRIDDKAPFHPKARILTVLAQQLSGAEKETVLAEALSTAQRIIDRKDSRALALSAVASELNEPEKQSALRDALTATLECEGDEPRMEALIALVPQLNGPLLAEALSATRGIKGEQCRTIVVEAIAKNAGDKLVLLEEIRRYIVDRLWNIASGGYRHDVYDFCSNEHLFNPPFVSTQDLERIAKQIGEIGLRWRWP